MKNIYYWPDGSWYPEEELEEALIFKSDNFQKVVMADHLDSDEIDERIQEIIESEYTVMNDVLDSLMKIEEKAKALKG